jgi:hypothetical protein
MAGMARKVIVKDMAKESKTSNISQNLVLINYGRTPSYFYSPDRKLPCESGINNNLYARV